MGLMQVVTMNNSRGSPRASGDLFENMELLQNGTEDADYRPLGHAEDDDQADDLEEFNIPEMPRPKSRTSQWLWWTKWLILAIVCLGIAAVFLHWVGPIFLDKVRIRKLYSLFLIEMPLSSSKLT